MDEPIVAAGARPIVPTLPGLDQVGYVSSDTLWDEFSKLEAIPSRLVVLGGGHISDPKIPITGQLSDASMARLVEGIRLHRELPKSKLILSGGSFFDRVSNAKVLSEVAMAIGVKKKNILLEEISKDTEDQARLIQQIVSKDQFILVTSASHMPRTMAFFRKLGMDPLPAPTEHLVKESVAKTPERFYPSAGGLRKAERAFYEYLGLAWAKLRGQI